jgi:serine/threonine protein kinase
MSLENGFLLNERYRILDVLGQGGMGAVYRAFDENLDISVAVKENSFLSEDYARQFQREAKILASLRHPNLPRVFDYFVINQQGQYLVMDYIEGEDLRQWISNNVEITESDALQIGIAICDALLYLHSREPGITHRDIKPGNIKITPGGEVLLVDFGLVKRMHRKELTTTAARAMTPGYSPPEQYGDTPTDHRSDIYSLGATLYTALAGFIPEDGLSRATGKSELTPLRSYNPQISRRSADAIEKALSLQFTDRWQSAAVFKEALQAALEALPQQERSKGRLTWVDPYGNERKQGAGSGDTTGVPRQNLLARVRARLPEPVWLVYTAVILVLMGLLALTLRNSEAIHSLTPGFLKRTSTLAVVTSTEGELSDMQVFSTQTPFVSIDSISSPAPNLQESTLIAFTSTVVGGGRGELAFVSERSGIPQIWLINTETALVTQLTDLSEGACQPDWSPEGDRIVFTSPCPGSRSQYPNASLYILYLKNNVIQPLATSLEGDFDPAWSPDGEWIAYTTLVNSQRQIAKINLEDYSSVRLSDGVFQDFSPAWSQDSEQLVFVRKRGYDQIWIMEADGSQPVQFSYSGAKMNSNPAWYPEKGLILFSQSLGLDSPSKQVLGMRISDLGKPEEYPVMPEQYDNYVALFDHVDVSPDGYWLAVELWYYDVEKDIYIMTFPGSNLQQITDHPAMDYDPVWRP